MDRGSCRGVVVVGFVWAGEEVWIVAEVFNDSVRVDVIVWHVLKSRQIMCRSVRYCRLCSTEATSRTLVAM